MDANIAVSQFTSAAIIVWGMQRLKNASWFPFLQNGSVKVSRAVSVVAAFFAHAGLSYTWNPTLDVNGNRTLTLAIPTLTGAALLVWHWLGQYAMQETMYQATINKVAVTTDAAGSIPARVAPSGAVVVPPDPLKP